MAVIFSWLTFRFRPVQSSSDPFERANLEVLHLAVEITQGGLHCKIAAIVPKARQFDAERLQIEPSASDR